MNRAAAALVAALAATSCGAPLMKLPAGPFSPAADAADALTQATRGCRAVSTFTAEIGVGGSVGGRRLRARLLVGLASPASARLEAAAPFGQPIFVFVARGDDATLLLPRDRRVLEHGRPEAVLEAIAGVSLTPADLRTTLTGCAAPPPQAEGQRPSDDWRVIRGPMEVYLRREGSAAPWHVVAVVHRGPDQPEWRAEFLNFRDDLPRTIRLISADHRKFDLTLAVSQLEINAAVDPEAFRVSVPPGTTPITIEELRRSGPLAEAHEPNGDPQPVGDASSSRASIDAVSARAPW